MAIESAVEFIRKVNESEPLYLAIKKLEPGDIHGLIKVAGDAGHDFSVRTGKRPWPAPSRRPARSSAMPSSNRSPAALSASSSAATSSPQCSRASPGPGRRVRSQRVRVRDHARDLIP